MTVAITVNPKFKKLNEDPSYRIKPGGVGREAEVVVDIVVTTEDLSDAVIGNFITDFSGTGIQFRQVYSLQIIDQDDLTDLYFFNEGAASDAATASIDVVQIADGSVQNGASITVTLTAIIRGII